MHLFQLFLLLTVISSSFLFPLLGKQQWCGTFYDSSAGQRDDGVATYALVSLHFLKLCGKRK